ncbi:MAG TPA: cob(I)yrinic acid a,c-diamide adenosyltransferase [Syntrophobacteraceae bacterium]|nr:cob(I)yrinic acid a,c-diamide adenosyltransferase [Syntrophobacteraceae bacterium]
MEEGLLVVFTGNGKGKTTAALGMALRAAGHGMRVLFLQFIKGSRSYGELHAVQKLDCIEILPLGTGFTWQKESLEEDRQLARSGWEKAKEAIAGGAYGLIVLDELNYVLSYGLLPWEEVLEVLEHRPPGLHVVVTGRNAPKALISLADLATEMVPLKHPYHDRGLKAQRGIEY